MAEQDENVEPQGADTSHQALLRPSWAAKQHTGGDACFLLVRNLPYQRCALDNLGIITPRFRRTADKSTSLCPPTRGRSDGTTATQGSANKRHDSSTSNSNKRTKTETTGAGTRGRNEDGDNDSIDNDEDNGEGSGDDEGDDRHDHEQAANPVKQLFACPFYKLNPIRYKTCLFRHKLSKLPTVLQHLKRCHLLPQHCPNCGHLFDKNKRNLFDQHIAQQSCEHRDFHHLGVTKANLKELNRTRATSAKFTEKEKWYQYWAILFPNFERPESHYVDELFQEVHNMSRRAWKRVPVGDDTLTRHLERFGLSHLASDRAFRSGIYEAISDWRYLSSTIPAEPNLSYLTSDGPHSDNPASGAEASTRTRENDEASHHQTTTYAPTQQQNTEIVIDETGWSSMDDMSLITYSPTTIYQEFQENIHGFVDAPEQSASTSMFDEDDNMHSEGF